MLALGLHLRLSDSKFRFETKQSMGKIQGKKTTSIEFMVLMYIYIHQVRHVVDVYIYIYIYISMT